LVKVQNNEAFGVIKICFDIRNKSSKKEYLLFTDADCYPTSKLG
jgi:hypothetical protein